MPTRVQRYGVRKHRRHSSEIVMKERAAKERRSVIKKEMQKGVSQHVAEAIGAHIESTMYRDFHMRKGGHSKKHEHKGQKRW